jgi:hypothetical protein
MALASALTLDEDGSGGYSVVMVLDDAEDTQMVTVSTRVLEFILEMSLVAFEMLNPDEQRNELSFRFRSSLMAVCVSKTCSGFRADLADDLNVRHACISLLGKLE